MDLHNMDEFLDLQDQNTTNLLSTEQIERPEQMEEEWHSATPLDEMLSSADNDKVANWTLLQNGLDSLQDINLTEIIGQNSFAVDNTNCITPDFLIKQQQPAAAAEDEKRVTRSKTTIKIIPPVAKEEPKKKKATRAKKLYCICKQPYNGKPMVQCDRCKEWFHCACVGFNTDTEEDEEDIDWICNTCREESNESTTTTTQEQDNEASIKPEPQQEEKPKPTTTRQTRGAARQQSICLYEGCNNHTKADSFCSDVCARKHNEGERSTTRRTRVSAMKSPTIAESPKQDNDKDNDDNDNDDNDNDDNDNDDVNDVNDDEETTTTTAAAAAAAAAPMSPSQMTEEENPVRRNVIKNMTAILKPIFDTALEKTPELFDADIEMSSQARAEQLAKSIENTILEELGDMKGRRSRTCGEPYKSKFRSLLYNLKDKANEVFQVRVVTGDLSPLDLVTMSSEDMANPELKSMAEVLRQKSLKESVLKLENTPIIKKTHKGDIIMMPNSNNENMYSEQVQRELDKVDQHKHTPVPVVAVEKEISSLSPTLAASSDPLDDILARISLPVHNNNNDDDYTNTTKRSLVQQDDDPDSEAKKRKKLAEDVEKRLGKEEDTHFEVDEVDLKDEDEDMDDNGDMAEVGPEQAPGEQKEEEEEETVPSMWEGRVNMPQVAEFEAKARQIGGRVLSPAEWEDVLSPTMWVEGRIPTDRVNNYITQTQYSQSREIVLLEIEATAGDADEQSQVLLEYFETRQRYAVVGHNKSRIKDFYLVPLYKSQHIPDCLYVVRVEETKRKNDMFLGVLVLSKQAPPPEPPKKEVAVVATPQTYEPQQSSYQPYQTYQSPQIYQQQQQSSAGSQFAQPYQYGHAYQSSYNNTSYPQSYNNKNNNYRYHQQKRNTDHKRYYNNSGRPY